MSERITYRIGEGFVIESPEKEHHDASRSDA